MQAFNKEELKKKQIWKMILYNFNFLKLRKLISHVSLYIRFIIVKPWQSNNRIATSSPLRSRIKNGSGHIQMPFVCAFEPERNAKPWKGMSESSQSPVAFDFKWFR
jgi:hypothetical protein